MNIDFDISLAIITQKARDASLNPFLPLILYVNLELKRPDCATTQRVASYRRIQSSGGIIKPGHWQGKRSSV